MFLILSKTLDWLLAPLSWSIVLFALGLLLSRRRPRAARVLLTLAALVLLAFSTELVSSLLYRKGEASALRTFRADTTYDAVVLLGGGLDPDGTRIAGTAEINSAGDRLLRTFELLRAGNAQSVLISAGTLDPRPSAVPEAVDDAKALEKWGIDRARIFEEPRSRNTRENAVESARIAKEKGWTRLLLVTSALHMPRALGCYRAVGLSPDTLPVDFRGGEPRYGLVPRASNLNDSTEVLRELSGRVIYRLMGYAGP